MTQFQLIEAALQRTVRRRRLDRAWRGFWRGLLVGGIAWLLVLAAYKLLPIPAWSLLAGAAAAGVLALGGLLAGACRSISVPETARWIDGRQHLQERLSTALEVSDGPGSKWRELVVSDAALHVTSLNVRELLPLRFHPVSRWALIVLVLSAGLGFVPEYRSQKHLENKQDAARVRETGQQLAELIRRNLQQRQPLLEPTQKAMEAVAELGDKLSQQTLTRSEALRDLTSVTEKLSQQAREMEKNPALKPLERAARESNTGGLPSPGELQKQMESLQKSLGSVAGNPDKLDQLQKNLEKLRQSAANLPGKDSPAGAAAREQMSQALNDMARQAQELGASLPGLEEAIAALQSDQTGLLVKDLKAALSDLEKMKDMAQAMQQLQQQMAKLGKDLAEQLKNGQAQAAVSTLQKMIEQLKSANLSPEQLQKLIDEVAKAADPAGDYGDVANHLEKAAQQMQKGEKSDAAQSLAAASKELEKLMQQMADSESMEGTLDALRRAQMAVATRQSWEAAGTCKACQGAGCKLCQGKGRGWRRGGKPGAGVGTWAEEQGWTFPEESEPVDNSGVTRPDMAARGTSDRGEGDVNPNLLPTKVRGQMSPGGSMPSITLKGVSIKGQSTVGYQAAATAAQAEAQSALNQDQVPRAYQGAVRDYFDDLKK